MNIPDSPQDIFDRNRKKYIHLLGDVFNSPEGEFTLFHIENNTAYGVLVNGDDAILKKILNWNNFKEKGFVLNEEFAAKEDGAGGWFGFRKLQDGSWAAISFLATTTAIIADINGLFFEKRYCFRHNDFLPSWSTAVYWLARFKTADSLPIGNCAFRGDHGLIPIEDINTTTKYYERLEQLKFNGKVDGFDLDSLGRAAMRDVIIKQSPNTKNTQAA